MEVVEHQQPEDQGDTQAASTSPALDGEAGCQMFAWLWERLSAVLGTPATAALMRRALSTASQSHPGLRGILISRERLTYSYKLPEESCAAGLEHPVPSYRAFLKEVLRLTGELTGGVMVRGLTRSEELSPWLSDIQEVDQWLTSGK